MYCRVGEHEGGSGQQHHARDDCGERGEAERGLRVRGTGALANRVITHRGVVVLPAALLGCKAPAYSRNYSAFPGTQGAPRRTESLAAQARARGRRPEGERPPAIGPCDLGVKGDDMPYYRVAGEIPGKRHVRFRRPMAACTPRS